MTVISQVPPIVVVFGGSGFLGRHVVRTLAKRGYRVRAASRNPNLAGHLLPSGNVGQIQPVQANLRVRWSIDRAVQGADHVINLVGILAEGGKQTFEVVQHDGARAVAEAARAAGAGMIHVSAIGADVHAQSAYARTKARGERAVLQTVKNAVVLRPSIQFGPGDGFFNRFGAMARLSPALPLVGGGHTKFQPVYVGDVAEAIARAVEGRVKGGRIYELGGPEVLSFKECMEELLAVIGRRRFLVPVPWGAASLLGSVFSVLPNPVITADQVEQLKHDNIVSAAAEKEGRTFAAFGIRPQAVEAILPSYLWQYRAAGQFSHPDPA